MRGRRPGSARRLLTPGQFIAHVDLMYETARGLVIKDGHAVEMLALLNCKDREQLVYSSTPEPLSRRPDYVRALARRHRACAAISVCESWLVWLTPGRDPDVDALPPSERPDREEVLVVSGTWPVMGISHTRCATILRPAEGAVDLVELDLAGALSAAGLPADGVLGSSSWLSELLPQY